jgi:putative peptidoglycan lipid II flippase
VFALAGKAIGFVQKIVMANCFGTGLEADAYTLAFGSIVFTLSAVSVQLLPPFLPLFVQKRRDEGDESAWRFAGSVGTIVAGATLLIGFIGLAFAPQLIDFASSFKSEETTMVAVRLVRIMTPAVLFMGVSSFLALVLQAHKRFAVPALGDTTNKLMLVVCVLALYKAFGIYGMALGVVAGSVAGVLVQGIGLRARLGSLRFGVDWRDPALRQFGVLIPPIFLSMAIAQVRTIIDYKLASGMAEGCTASLNYARALTDTLVFLVPSAVGVAIYPVFSDMNAADNREELTLALMRSLRMMVFIFIPISVGLIVLREPIVRIVFQRGQFSGESVALTVAPLTYYALGLAAFAVEIILMRFYFAMKNTLTPAVVGGICVAIHLCTALALRGSLQHGSMALAATVSKAAKAAILIALLRSALPGLRFKEHGLFLARTLVSAALMGGCVFLVMRMSAGIVTGLIGHGGMAGTVALAAVSAAAAVAGAVVFFAASIAVGTEEARAVLSLLKRRRSREQNSNS